MDTPNRKTRKTKLSAENQIGLKVKKVRKTPERATMKELNALKTELAQVHTDYYEAQRELGYVRANRVYENEQRVADLRKLAKSMRRECKGTVIIILDTLEFLLSEIQTEVSKQNQT